MSRDWLRRCPEPSCDVLVAPEGAEKTTCRNGHTFEVDDAFAVTTCEGCSDSHYHAHSIPGVRFAATSNGDASRRWIERCDECEEFDSDEDAADALVKAGRINGWLWATPYGSTRDQPYAVSGEVAARR